MVERIIERGFSYLGRKLGKGVHYHEIADINAKLRHFQIKRLAILVDGKTNTEGLNKLKDVSIVDYYSFSLDLIGTKVNGFEVQPLLPNTSTIDTDGWLVSAMNEFAGYSLNQYLLENSIEKQVVIQHVKAPQGTTYYSYIDFFSNEQRTTVQIHNYFDRCYRIPFPLDIRFTLRNTEGEKVETGQVIIPPNGIRVISSDDFAGQEFVGYLEIEFEVTSKVNPFLHYYANYTSGDFISNNHQSGLGLHPANSLFTRGYIPTSDDESLVVCLFQRNYSNPVNAKAILQYTSGNSRKTIEKDFPPINKNHMLFQDIKKLFREIDFSKAKAPCVAVQSEVPLHRPNYYYSQKGKKGYFDTSHAGPDPKNYTKTFGGASLTREERAKIQKFGCYEMELKQFIFPPGTGIESLLGLGNDTTIEIKQFIFDFYNEQGKLLYSFEDDFDYDKQTYINLNEYLKEKNIEDFSGTLSLRPSSKTPEVPVVMNGISAYRHRDNPYLTSTAASGSNADNIPFYFRAAPPNYIGGECSVGVTDIFGPGITSDIYDTYYAITYPCSNKNLTKKIEYEILVVNASGQKRVIHRTIPAHGCNFLKLSDLVRQTGHNSEGGYYTVWVFAVGAHLYGQRILLRKSDCAISVEHCYVGKYGL